ncbi:MAG: D-glycero-beta-D-manno-heptose-7-phosphate kinase [Proteobacteria bacterium]|nr:D-glycero-beta-D-manno-heptose-7-phosphate kinase [Pseudomonadota bacterium]MBU1389541.1 D-glycero-beta-D-manno-heptose-7-phosphate kinase [Pseudomonadota bacterium]MBU1544405.1 D-glycero-beta-D-manno-heptose-7-phosphate kinase [Pseudomonadota bacterium]MBU2480679.1 D-glycero-beta-D-manno-heptose-7-phosphate kinase [Pseudomonadota bacterium]
MNINIDDFKNLKAMVIGDLMVDEYLWGNVDRISPEAPVPIVCVTHESQTLGGAGNVINNLVSMGAHVIPIGTVGSGKAGQMILDTLKTLDIDTDGIVSEPKRPTTRKTRVIASNQQVLRIDREIKTCINAQTLNKLVRIIEKKINQVHLIIISDYDKGLVSKELVEKTVFLARQNNILVLADPKALDFIKYEHVSVLTPNKKEAGIAAHMSIGSREDLFFAGKKLMSQVQMDKLLITCGKDGMVLFEKDKEPYAIASKARQVFDVSGAGDTVISLLGLGLASGASFKDAAMVANAAAGIVIAKIGTATATIEELKKELLS